jgi:PAS domain S-box-containing protein
MLNKFLSLPIRIHFLILVFLIAIPLFCIMLVVGIMHRDDALEDAQRDCFKFVDSVVREEQVLVRGIQQLATTISVLPEVNQRKIHSARLLLSEILKENPQYTNITISDEYGRILVSALPFDKAESVAHLRYFKETSRTGMFSSGEYSLGKMTKKPIMIFGYPIKNAAGQLKGVISIGIDFLDIRHAFEKLKLPQGSSFSILDHEGIILYRHLQDKLTPKLTGSHDIAKEIFTSMQKGPEEGTFTAKGNDGNRRVFAYRKMSLPHETQPYLYIRASITEASVIAKASGRFYVVLFVIILTSLTGLLWAWFVGKRIIVDRVTALERASQQLAAGNDILNIAQVVKGGDLGLLAQAIDRIAKGIKEREAILRTILEAVNDSLFMIDQNGTVLEMNTTTANRFGKRPEAILGRNIYDFLPQPLAETRKKHQEKAAQTGQVIRFEDEREGRWSESTIYPVPGDGVSNRFVIYGRDVTQERKAAMALQERERALSTLLSNLPGMVYRCRNDKDWTMKFISSGCYKLTGYPEQDLIDNKRVSFNDLVAKEYQEPLWQKWQDILAKREPFEAEYPIIMASGETRWVWERGQGIFSETGELLFLEGYIQDIDERKRALDAMAASEMKYRIVADHTYDWEFWLDRDDRLLYSSPSCERISGYEKGEFMNDYNLFSNILHPDDRLVYVNHHLDTTQSRKAGESEFRLIRKDGSICWISHACMPVFDDKGCYGGIRGSNRDITDRKRSENELRASELKFRSLTDGAPVGIFLTDSHGDCLYVNPRWQFIAGLTPEEAYGRGWCRAIHPEDRERVNREWYEAAQAGQMFSSEYRFKTPQGVISWVIGNSVAMYDDQELITGHVGTIIDITEQKQLELGRQEMADRLQRAEKMEALGLLAGGVAHDLNNVLGVVITFSELLMDKIDESSPLRSFAKHIFDNSDRAALIVEDLLTMARRGVHTEAVINLNRVIAEYLNTPEHRKLLTLYPHIQVKTELESSLLNVKGSPVHLAKTFMNLILNAAEAIKTHGDITIRTRNVYLDRPVRGYDDVREEDYAVLSVSDTGEGIGTDDLKRIFEPFYTKKVMGRSGSGLGLAVVWGTVKDHHGYIDVQTEVGRGSTFTLFFPVTREELSGQPVSVPAMEYMGGGESLLVVDDVEGQRLIAMQLLGKLNYQVTAVGSGEEAVEFLRTHTVDLLVLDMIMDPGIGGLETYRKVLEIRPGQKAIIVSGFSESERVHAVQALGAGAYVKKPYILQTIGLAVKHALQGV